MKGRTTTPKTLSMAASRWNIKYSVDLPSHPVADGAGWSFILKKDTSEVDYILCDVTAAILKPSISMAVEVTADPSAVFDFSMGGNTGALPSCFRFLLLKDVTTEFGRWFSNPYFIELKPGTNKTTLTVPFDPEKWSSVYGKFGNANDAALQGFKRVLASPVSLGICFGGGSFFGHGIRVHNSSAKFKMLDYSLV